MTNKINKKEMLKLFKENLDNTDYNDNIDYQTLQNCLTRSGFGDAESKVLASAVMYMVADKTDYNARYDVYESDARTLINNYYINRDSNSFFAIVDTYNRYLSENVNKNLQFMVEMSNVIVMG